MGKYYGNSTFYVSLDGSDCNNGINSDKPFLTLEHALNVVRGLRKDGIGQPITIRIHGGEYEVADTIKITPDLNLVTIEAFDNIPVILSGGKKITGFNKTQVNGVDCYSVYLPEVADGSYKFTDLYVDGIRADYTRYPETGYLRVQEVEYKGADIGNFGGLQGSHWFTAKKGDMKSFKNIENSIVSFCHFWIDEHSPIKSYDPLTEKVTMQYKSRFRMDSESGDSNGVEYIIENIIEELKKPNQWYLDTSDGMLYYIPKQGQMLDTIDVHAPRLSKLFEIVGDCENGNIVKNIRFSNITFAYTRGDYESNLGVHSDNNDEIYASDSQAVSNASAAITFEGARGCAIEKCGITNFGLYAIDIGDGCSNMSIIGNTIYDGGAGGIKINGSDSNGDECKRTHNNRITDNIINHCGRRYMSACGIIVKHSYENEISHNEISDLFYTGISCGWIWGYSESVTRDNRIEKNHIYNLGQGVLSDMGGIYLLGAQPGTLLKGNLIHDIERKMYGGWALYTDEGSGFITAEDNICYDTSSNAYHQHYGSMNTVRNNIFAFSKDEVLAITRYEEHLSIIFENNIIYTNGTSIYNVSESHIKEQSFGSSKNLIFDCKNNEPTFTKASLTLEDMQKQGFEKDSVIADPLFKNTEKRDFTLCCNSPAFSLGFKAIDMSDVGSRVHIK